MYIWIIKRPNILPYLVNIGVALGIYGGNQRRVISEGNTSPSWRYKCLRLYKFAFCLYLYECLQNSYSVKHKVNLSTNKKQTKDVFCLVYEELLFCFFHCLSDDLISNSCTLAATSLYET